MSNQNNYNARIYMQLAIEEMKRSVAEPRSDGEPSPKVGTVLLKRDNSHMTAYRGEYRNGDHAEFTLLEKKNRNQKLDNSILFTTLEPCAPGARKFPKLSCAERIVNARIKEVWIGLEDPHPKVDRKGIKFLQDNNVTVNIFPPDLQDLIRINNKEFIEHAEKIANQPLYKKPEIVLSKAEHFVDAATFDNFSESALSKFISKAGIDFPLRSPELNQIFNQLGILTEDGKPTGYGLLLFGTKPQFVYPHAIIKGEFVRPDGNSEIKDFEGPLVFMPGEILDWVESKIGSFYVVEKFEGKTKPDFHIDPFREGIINAIVHRDYDIESAPIYFSIDSKKAIIKSPGLPVNPITIDQLNNFTASSLSRNPVIMYVFNQLNLAEQRGKGMSILKNLSKDYDIPSPLYSFHDPYLQFTLFRTSDILNEIIGDEKFVMLNEDERKGLIYIYNVKSIRKSEYAKYFEFDDKKAQRHLTKMKKLELISTEGAGPALKYRFVYK